MNIQFRNNFNRNMPESTSQNIQNKTAFFMANFANKRPPPNVLSRDITPPTPVQVAPKPKTMIWGEPTWFLLHTLAEKVLDDRFSEVRIGLLNTIYLICTNLPCPDCASHAKMYLDSVHFLNIQTKDQLKMCLFNFHNSVNARKGYTIFTVDELNDKYSVSITVEIIYNFFKFFSPRNRSIRMISNDLFRNRMINNIKTWINANIQNFNL